ncbi:MAG: hypothetical protein HDQ88_08260 [Clostridia bacterium]|nr:hypothetical protein [Clostridia bacterium]
MTLTETINAVAQMSFGDMNLKITVLNYLSELKRMGTGDAHYVTTRCGKLRIMPTPYHENYLDKGPDFKPAEGVTYYPGVSIDIENDDGTIIDLCLVEGPSDEDVINIYIYGDAHSDEYTEKVTVKGEDIRDPD